MDTTEIVQLPYSTEFGLLPPSRLLFLPWRLLPPLDPSKSLVCLRAIFLSAILGRCVAVLPKMFLDLLSTRLSQVTGIAILCYSLLLIFGRYFFLDYRTYWALDALVFLERGGNLNDLVGFLSLACRTVNDFTLGCGTKGSS
jgi:hypothetical protein